MTACISILRGINVSGQNIIKMDALQKMYKDLGYSHITTYIQSGNIVFNVANAQPEKLEKEISNQIKTVFGFDVPVIVLTVDSLQEIIDNNPFAKDLNKDPGFLHVTFLSSTPEQYDIEAIEAKKSDGEEIVIDGHAVYLYCPNGYGNTKLNNSLLEKKLKVGATTRNWKTANKLLEIAKNTG
ncbi:MAG: DUF1697 domain-containing protein [Tannerella sp.]|jgi:uncharacterized protein (DUF1697 family)|nr:DUF1697 domain-containing protein [Tannerella sp.]